MDGFPWIMIMIIVGLMLVGILVMVSLRRKKEGSSKGTGYRTIFILGITFLPLGIIYEIIFLVSDQKVFLVLGLSFIAMGLSYLAIGLGNKEKWNKQ